MTKPGPMAAVAPAELAAMRRALILAADPSVPLGPNPRVGAVLLSSDGAVIAEGFHRGTGTDHAETAALAAAGSTSQGATMVVTLEPCNHHGRTGPCADALVDAGVARVVYAQSEVGWLAAGGAQRLRDAGIAVESGVLADEAAALNPVFTAASRLGRPFVTYKFAATLDGRIAAADGSSQWITSEASRLDAHRLRAEVDAILVGTGTALHDNPTLTVRGVDGLTHQPLRVVMGLRDLSDDAALLVDGGETLQVRTHAPTEVLDALAQRGVSHVLLEGGPTIAGAFVRARLVDRVVAYLAPTLLGGGKSVLEDSGISTLSDALSLTMTDFRTVGGDVRLTATVAERK